MQEKLSVIGASQGDWINGVHRTTDSVLFVVLYSRCKTSFVPGKYH